MAARQSRLGSKFLNLKILNFLLLPQNFTTNQGLHSKFSHPTPRAAYQCSYAKEIRWIGPKLTELEPFSWTRSKFAIFDEVKIRHFGRILISAVRAQFWGDRPHFFSCCPIIVYILGSYHALPLNPDFWVNLCCGNLRYLRNLENPKWYSSRHPWSSLWVDDNFKTMTNSDVIFVHLFWLGRFHTTIARNHSMRVYPKQPHVTRTYANS